MAFPEPDLQTAGFSAYSDLLPTYEQYKAGGTAAKTTRVTTLAFCAALATTIPASLATGNPINDLLAVLAAQATNLPVFNGGLIAPFLTDFNRLVLTMYKLLLMAAQLSDPAFPSGQQITTAQANAILAAYNTAFNI